MRSPLSTSKLPSWKVLRRPHSSVSRQAASNPKIFPHSTSTSAGFWRLRTARTQRRQRKPPRFTRNWKKLSKSSSRAGRKYGSRLFQRSTLNSRGPDKCRWIRTSNPMERPPLKRTATTSHKASHWDFERRLNEEFADASNCSWFRNSILDGTCDCGHGSCSADSRNTLFGDEMADDRAISRGESECSGGRAGESRRLLLWRGWRRGLEDDGRRDGVETDLRQRSDCFDWSDGAGAFESQNHLRGNGRQHDFWRQQLRRWNLQVHGWRGELAAHGPGGLAAHRENPG